MPRWPGQSKLFVFGEREEASGPGHPTKTGTYRRSFLPLQRPPHSFYPARSGRQGSIEAVLVQIGVVVDAASTSLTTQLQLPEVFIPMHLIDHSSEAPHGLAAGLQRRLHPLQLHLRILREQVLPNATHALGTLRMRRRRAVQQHLGRVDHTHRQRARSLAAPD
eukprot:scaffold23_cov268-Pinguiococcus_pyrenoidosus.AAC.16